MNGTVLLLGGHCVGLRDFLASQDPGKLKHLLLARTMLANTIS